MWFDRCNAIHTVGMRIPIDVVFLDNDLRVVQIRPNVSPFRFIVRYTRACSVLELCAGRTAEVDLRPGDRLHMQ
jgi:uncharacterized membrane protein (UPF0127 family)